MRLSDFIESNADAIVEEWATFAHTIDVDGTMNIEALRDHAAEILSATVDDMRSEQSGAERDAKSKGRTTTPADGGALNDASEMHAVDRIGWGFDVMEVVSEYRALRASVLRLWTAGNPEPDSRHVDDVTRFNESIDQSLAKTVRSFSRRVEQARDTFLAMLGHDLRNPLQAIALSAQVLPAVGADSADGRQYLDAIASSTRAMKRMIGDLLDFTRTRLGSGMPIALARTDVGPVVEEVEREIRAAHPECTLRHDASGDLVGHWDADRLRQALSNVLGNACQHGAAGRPITVSVDGRDPDRLRARVHNEGEPIAAAYLPLIFDPLVRGPNAEAGPHGATHSIGLGLFIAREVVRAHGGTIDVTSTAAAGTTFTMMLPRRPSPAAPMTPSRDELDASARGE